MIEKYTKRRLLENKRRHKIRTKKYNFAMDSSDKEAMKRLRSLLECCICLNAYTDPRLLPCFHTACLKCFEDLQSKNQKKASDVLPCPLCRNEFSIPAEGMTGLQKNFFIESLMEITRAFNVENESVLCNTCSIVEDASAINNATVRCLNCCENYCTRCSKIHKGQKLGRDHKIVKIKVEINEDEIRNMIPIRKCLSHSDKDLDYYCSDCKTVVCVSCFVEDHQTHKCKDVKKLDKYFRQRLEEHLRKMSGYTERILSKKCDMERQKEEYLQKTKETENCIKEKNQQLKALIDQHTEDVLNELSRIKQKHQKQMKEEFEEIERKLTVLQSFMTFCTELKSKGSPSEVCGNVDSLITRAKELSKENELYLISPSKPFDIKFIATDQNALLRNVGSIAGKLSESTKLVQSCAVIIGIYDVRSLSDDVIKINLTKSEAVCDMQKMPTKMVFGTAAAVYCNSIFVTGLGKSRDEIWRFNATSSKWTKCASLVQGRQLHSVAFVDHILYICGGWVESTKKALDDVEAYDIFDDECSSIRKLVFAVFASGNCVPYNSSLYIFGGINSNGNAVSNVQVYDTKLHTSNLFANPLPRADGLLRAAQWESTVILLGSNGCFTYNFETEVWKVRNRFKTDVNHFGLTISNGLVFVIGGGRLKKDADGNRKWIGRYDVRCVPAVNILNDEPIEWKQHAKLPKPSLVSSFGILDVFI